EGRRPPGPHAVDLFNRLLGTSAEPLECAARCDSPGPRGRWSGWTLPVIPSSTTGGRAGAVSPGPPRDGSAASHLEGRIAFVQAGPPPFSRTCIVQRVGGDGNYRAPAGAWGRSVSDLQAGGSA